MKQLSIKLLSMFASVAVVGCANPNVMKLPSQVSDRAIGDNEALLVVGNHTDAHLAWDRVTVEAGVSKPMDGLKLYDHNKNRFTVWKIGNLRQAGTLGLATVIDGTRYFSPCDNALMPVVTLSPGEIVYVGDFRREIVDGRLSMQWSFDVEAAARSVEQQWSSDAAAKLSERRLEFVKTSAKCGGHGTVTIPIYLPRR